MQVSKIIRTAYFLIAAILPNLSQGQVIIKTEKINNVYYVPCKVNGLSLKFIFDTGASNVSISLTEADFMLKNGYLKNDDIKGIEQYKLANGEITEGTKIILKEIEIGGLKLYNVEASVVHNLDAPMLFGQSAIEKLGLFTFNTKENEIIIENGISLDALCSFDEIFPVKHSISKFKATTTLATMNNIIIEKGLGTSGSWWKFDYLINDSVLMTHVNCDIAKNMCLKGKDNELYLRFVDDKLYKINLTLKFPHDKFQDCMRNYEELITIFKNQFPYFSQTEKTTNSLTNEEIAEGRSFYPSYSEYSHLGTNNKTEYLEINYSIEYERKLKEFGGFYETGNIENYVIEILFYNIYNTKLTAKGY